MNPGALPRGLSPPSSPPRSPRRAAASPCRAAASPRRVAAAARPAAALTYAYPAPHGVEVGDDFAGLVCEQGRLTVAGFGSLLSPTSARSTFPALTNFRLGLIPGWRRVFAHQCSIFYERGIADAATGEVSSLSVEPHPGSDIVVTLFEVEATPDAVAAFIEREHEFRFVAVRPQGLGDAGEAAGAPRPAVMCARNSDEEYRARRCPPHEWERRYGRHGLDSIWRDDVLPCRVYLRHCALAAAALGSAAENSFLDGTVLADRTTTVRQWLEANPSIMEEAPPPSLSEALSSAQLDAAPFRFSLRAEADDSLLGCSSGLAGEILVDEALKLAVWGGDLALAFPDVDALRQFAGALRGVATQRVRLDDHPCAALLHNAVAAAA